MRIAITTGEPAGIGPEICARLAEYEWPGTLELIGDPELLQRRAARSTGRWRDNPAVTVAPIPLTVPATCGQPDPANSRYVLQTISYAVNGCLSGRYDAMVTAPVQKSVIRQAGFAFSGHTEYIARLCGCQDVVMMLQTTGLRVALVTTHLPLAEVSRHITEKRITTAATILHKALQDQFAIARPHILVCGLNPHAGESGTLGHEEQQIIAPAIAALQQQGLAIEGPFPADSLFIPKYLDHADAILAMYHDQGLPVLKHKGFGKAVNVTLGLPMIRTSVDHGTALDIAGQHDPDPGSLIAAVELACSLVSNHQHQGTQHRIAGG